ncbi:MAG: VOC family protein [Pseudomonadota bacterium]
MTHTDPNIIRADFSAAMSAMYREEVPAYGTLLELVADTNAQALAADPELKRSLIAKDDLARLNEERHGAIRLGTAEELATMARLFAVMGMHPVGYYDLSVAGIPVHSTAFRPIEQAALASNPFRVFTSLLRLDLVQDASLRRRAEEQLADRQIFTAGCLRLIEKAEAEGGLGPDDAQSFVSEALETFRWHASAPVTEDFYNALHDTHRLIADVVSFRGPHINHLTPRTLDIDAAQAEMPKRGIAPKAVVEGPPPRKVPILLRQTSFKALTETVRFKSASGEGKHTARFGEIEQRGAALTPKGRALYDRLLAEARAQMVPAPDGSNAGAYMAHLGEVFSAFPDDFPVMHREGLAYGRHVDGVLKPITYEDFLPVSAAGIFQSNLGDDATQAITESPNKAAFEQALGMEVADEFALYATMADSAETVGAPA